MTAAITYLDTSSLIKAYLEEDRSGEVVQLLKTSPFVASSLVTYAELRAGLAAALRGSRLSEAEHLERLREFEEDWEDVDKRQVTEPLVRLAGDLAEEHGLRGFDAIHLASAVALRRELDEPVTFSAFDDRLNDAAVACGLDLP